MQEEDISMSLELIKENVKVNRVIGTDSVQAIIDNDIIVPDTKPDIIRILILDGDVCETNTEILQDKVLINGMINLKILYISDDSEKSIKSINTNAGFSHTLQIENARSGMNCRVKCEIEHMNYDILNGRKLNIKTIMKIDGKLTQELEQGIINDLKDMDDVQILKENIKMNSYIGETNTNYSIKESLEVPAGKPSIREILRNDIKISGKDYKITDNKIAAKGEINISTLYIGDNEEQGIQFMEHEIPFTEFIDLPGINEDAVCELEYKVDDYSFESAEDNDGELRILNGEIMLNIYSSGSNVRNVEVIADAYCPGTRLTMEKEPFIVEENMAENKGQIILKDTIVLSDECPDIYEVFNVLCKPGLSDIKILDDKVIIEGVINNNVLYLANNSEQPVFSYKQDIPFRHGVDIKGIKQGMKCEPEVSIEHCSYSMVSSNEVEIRLVIGLCIRVSNNTVLQLIVKINEAVLEDNKIDSQPSIIIYFAKQGDTLWKIAKNYYTTMEYIESVNNLSAHNVLAPGQQIIIPKKSN
jgi:hypothetical protein